MVIFFLSLKFLTASLSVLFMGQLVVATFSKRASAKRRGLRESLTLMVHMVVYRFTYPIQGCLGTYTSVISCHVQEGTIYKHFINKHRIRATQDGS